MTSKPHNVRIEQYFFPETHVVALQNHDPAGELHGTKQKVSHHIEKVEGDQIRHGVSLIIETDDEASVNPPYQYKIGAYGVFQPQSDESEELLQGYLDNVEPVAIQILMGAAREHLAAITARSPWATFICNAATINFTFPDQEALNEQDTD